MNLELYYVYIYDTVCRGPHPPWYGIPPPAGGWCGCGGGSSTTNSSSTTAVRSTGYRYRGIPFRGERQRATREAVHIIILILHILQKILLKHRKKGNNYLEVMMEGMNMTMTLCDMFRVGWVAISHRHIATPTNPW